MGGLQFHDFYRGGHSWHIDGAHYLVSPHGGGAHPGYCRFYQWYRGHTGLRAVPLRGSSSGQAPGYLLEPQRPLLWLGTLILFAQEHWLQEAFRWVGLRNIPKVPPFFLQEARSFFLLPRATVVVVPWFSRIARDTSHSGHLMGGMHLHPLWVFLSFVSHAASWSGRISQLLCPCGGEGNQILPQSSRASTLGDWWVLPYLSFRYGRWNSGIICQWRSHRTGLGILYFTHGSWDGGVCGWHSLRARLGVLLDFSSGHGRWSSKVICQQIPHRNGLGTLLKLSFGCRRWSSKVFHWRTPHGTGLGILDCGSR